jgi:hypothetical protein
VFPQVLHPEIDEKKSAGTFEPRVALPPHVRVASDRVSYSKNDEFPPIALVAAGVGQIKLPE